MPSGGSLVSGFQQAVTRKLDTHGSMIRALLKNTSGTAGAFQTLGMTFFHDAGMTHEMFAYEDLTTAAGVGVGDEFERTGALCGVWTAHAVRRHGTRTRARCLLPNRIFVRITITVLFNWNRA